MMILAKDTGIELKLLSFYIVGICIPLSIAAGALVIHALDRAWLGHAVALSVVVVVGAGALVKIVTPTAAQDLRRLDAALNAGPPGA